MPAEVGILLVHGIGTQARGETTVNLGEPLYRALKKWIEPPSAEYDLLGDVVKSKPQQPSLTPQRHVQLVEVVAAPLQVSDPTLVKDPAYARIRITTNEADPPVEWLIAKSHWATSFPLPDPRLVTLWLMRVAPWIFISFVGRHIHMALIDIRSASSASRWLLAGRLCLWGVGLLAALAVTGPLTLLLDVFLVGLLVAWLIPLKVVRDLVSRINIVIFINSGRLFRLRIQPVAAGGGSIKDRYRS